MSRIRRLGLVAIMAVALLVGGAPAFATEPLTTDGHITDPDSFLSDEQRATIESPAQSFYSTYNTIIDVVVVPNFSGQKPSDWCKATLKQSRTGEKGILYVVSYEDGTDAFCTDAKMAREMSDYSTRMMMDSALSAAHRKYKTTPLPPEEAAAGAEAFIRDLRSSYDISADLAASHRKRQEQEKKAREETEKEEKKRKRGANILISAVVVIAIVSNVWVWVRKLNGDDEPTTETTYRSPEPEEYTPIVDTVRRDALRAATEARRRLSEAEEQVRAAEEDWNYARAQFGSAATEQFGHRLEAAKDAIARGFDTYEQIERTPDAHAKRRLASTITADLDKNLPPLQDARQEFAAQSEKRLSLPAQVADARERLVEELADLERAKEELTSIAGLYPGSMLASLQDNPERAAALLESARAALETAKAHLDTDPTRTASALDTAQRALSMANAQTDAIFSAKTDLDTFREKLAASIGSVSQSLSDAKHLDSAAASFGPLLDEAEAAIACGQQALVSDEDPLGALESLRDVELRLEAVLAPLTTQDGAQRRARETAERDIRNADAALTRAREHLNRHEGSALFDVNKLMREAEQAVTAAREALDEDPLQASAAASRATTLAERAIAAPGRH